MKISSNDPRYHGNPNLENQNKSDYTCIGLGLLSQRTVVSPKNQTHCPLLPCRHNVISFKEIAVAEHVR